MNSYKANGLLRSYRIFYPLVLITVIVGGLLFAGGVKPEYFPFFILLILPAISPVLIRFILEEEKPEFFFYYATTLFVFTIIYTIAMPKIGLFVLLIWAAELALSLMIGFYRAEKAQPPYTKIQELGAFPAEEIDVNWQAPAPPVLSPKAVLQQRMHELDREIQHYAEKLTPLLHLNSQSKQYLKEVDERLNYPHLSASNRETSLQLQEVLQTSIDNYQLMIRFFEEAKMRYEREKQNLKEKMGNLEIIDFLQDADRMKEIAAIEQAALDIEFQRQLRRLENELPTLHSQMNAKVQLLSHDLKEELTETIERLQHS